VNKIIFVNRYFYPDQSATSQMLSDLAFALAESGNRICIVTSRQTYENPQDDLAPRETRAGVEIFRVATTRFGRSNLLGRALDYLSFYVSSFVMLLRIAQRDHMIVAKTDPPLISVIAWVAARLKGARLVNWLQDVFPEVAVALGVLTWRPLVESLRWLRDLSLRGAEMNVVLGEYMQDRICQQGVAREKTRIIHNWADGDLIRPVDVASNQLRKSWGLADRFVVGYSGNMGRAHEFDTIVEAMAALKDDMDIVFLFIGGGAGKEKLEVAITERDLCNVMFRPYQPRERLAESLSLPDVHLVSLQPQLEGLIVPSKVYGIAAAGRPVAFVGDPEGEVARLVSRYGFGFAVAIGAGEELAHRLRSLKQQSGVAMHMGAEGRRYFEENLSKSHAIASWQGLIDGVAGRS